MRLNICNYCKHSFDNRPGCKAFPERIPLEITTMKFDHRYAFEGDQGIQFEAEDTAPKSVLEWLGSVKRFGETKP